MRAAALSLYFGFCPAFLAIFLRVKGFIRIWRGLPPYPIIRVGRNFQKFWGLEANPTPCISTPVH